MRLYGLVGLLVILSACDPISAFATFTPDVLGKWQDDAAAFTVCGETFPVATVLDLTQTGAELIGTFAVQGNANPFTGTAAANSLTGEVRGAEGSGLTAALTLQQNRLVGTFTAIAEMLCGDGDTSVTVYEVNLVR